jgi:hypothetical protein
MRIPWVATRRWVTRLILLGLALAVIAFGSSFWSTVVFSTIVCLVAIRLLDPSVFEFESVESEPEQNMRLRTFTEPRPLTEPPRFPSDHPLWDRQLDG